MTFWYYDIMMGLPEDAERSQAQRFEKNFMSYWIAFTHCPYAIALPYSRGGRSVAQHNFKRKRHTSNKKANTYLQTFWRPVLKYWTSKSWPKLGIRWPQAKQMPKHSDKWTIAINTTDLMRHRLLNVPDCSIHNQHEALTNKNIYHVLRYAELHQQIQWVSQSIN